ncbi:CoA-acylating methylmalonate-semialdehyde dehydrogenase [Oerskovia turbata]|uniref:methylmalonate-semialdehyde dehydrogenase (CoA acylating) n=1 Tax=Oerskovia turbata TaxID=1713 RepID=A0A4Q1L442_9CELL|nr:CoA-acylating methylmalonate-semialdehyde dehydrogenase [Oerskovia turbata]RXR26276.1 CoA-acylating methylmalonate-semialdehyde dehydrogenase [Oerskovia turbata]RXR36778.1 CoA-acylating methylmalonate-semialdehyde dehydrogenase [Oerskovia turbata]TGJ97466.1 methylmalonate-semialdehyde dehydrogenase (CoA acylating) [Actinotalea fermentans ATCC 43279 = JCM 9966 = DSM 3133]
MTSSTPERTPRVIGHVVGGRRVEEAQRYGAVHDPATGRVTGRVALASAADVDAAVAAALAAFPGWSRTGLSRRVEILFAFHELLRGHRDEIARLVSAEHGKVVSDAEGEVARALENVEFATGIPHLLKGGFSQQVSTGVDVHEVKQPLGVMVGITPFNFPAMVPLWMIPTAIACGNTFVLKPSERDPSASLLVARLLAEAGLPDGVVNVVQGDRVAVDRLLEHPDVAAISFVGSTPVARHVYETGTRHGKRVQALGGAKNHLVVLPDAELDAAADAAVSAGYGSAGERCMAISVVVAVGDVADALVEAIRTRVAGLVVGPGNDPASQMGPLITAEHRDRVAARVGSAVDEGAVLVLDGRDGPPVGPGADGQDTSGGFFLRPSLVDHVRPEHTVYREEIFGPVLSVVRVETFDDALRLVDENPYGNGAAIFTRDGGAARRFEVEVQAGMVGVNVPIPVPVGYYSFGGWKGSLFGDSHMYGPEGIHFATRTKVVTSRWPDPATSSIDLGFPRTR